MCPESSTTVYKTRKSSGGRGEYFSFMCPLNLKPRRILPFFFLNHLQSSIRNCPRDETSEEIANKIAHERAWRRFLQNSKPPKEDTITNQTKQINSNPSLPKSLEPQVGIAPSTKFFNISTHTHPTLRTDLGDLTITT